MPDKPEWKDNGPFYHLKLSEKISVTVYNPDVESVLPCVRLTYQLKDKNGKTEDKTIIERDIPGHRDELSVKQNAIEILINNTMQIAQELIKISGLLMRCKGELSS